MSPSGPHKYDLVGVPFCAKSREALRWGKDNAVLGSLGDMESVLCKEKVV